MALPMNRSRRRLLTHSSRLATGAALTSALAPLAGAYAQSSIQAPVRIASDGSRPRLDYGLQFGDPTLALRGSSGAPQPFHHGHIEAQAIAWTRADRPARLHLAWSVDEGFRDAVQLPPLWLHPSNDQTGRIDLTGLPPGHRVYVRAWAESLDGSRAQSEPVVGSFITPSAQRQNIRFVWGGDTVGQGWGISPSHGGMTIYRTMLEQNPAFFVHSGDTIYADGPIAAEQVMPDGGVWQNVVTEAKSKVAETLDEFRGAYRYNMLDEHLLAFNQGVAQIWQWDDHEVTNNWSGSKDLSADARYTEKSVAQLTERATQAFLEYAPIRFAGPRERDRIYRRISHGPLLDLFMIDMRSYRGPNSANLQAGYDPASWFLGPEQLAWLEQNLTRSRAVWKVICADMPIGLQVGDGQDSSGQSRWEAIANGDPGLPLGREQEIARLLSLIRRERVRNVVWLTADVHYCAAHHYHPDRAAFRDFEPFWEFVAGPLHAGAFGPGKLDPTFGPAAVFEKGPAVQNEPPLDHNQFFGQVDIDAESLAMKVALKDRTGQAVFERLLPAA